MKKLILATVLIVYVILICLPAGFAQEVARLKDLTINELSDSIDLKLSSSKTIKYNTVDYMNGTIGVKLLNTTLDKKFNSNSTLEVGQKTDIDEAKIIQTDPYTVEITIKGNKNITNKNIQVNNDVQRSNIILIEPDDFDSPIDIIPLVGDTVKLPEINAFEMGEDLNRKVNIPLVKHLEIKEPISMFTQQSDINNYTKGKKLLAQAQPFEDDTTILDMNEDVLDQPLSETTKPASINDSSITSSTNSSYVPEEETKDALDLTEIDEPVVTEAQSPGFFSKVLTFLKEQWMWFAGAGGCVIVLIIGLAIIGIVFNSSRGPEAITQEEQEFQEMPPQQQAAPIVDNEPVTYIPPSQLPNSQSITDAINQIISIRNRSGK